MNDGLVNASDYQNWLSDLNSRGILSHLHPDLRKQIMNPQKMTWLEKNITNRTLANLESSIIKGQIRDLIDFYECVRQEASRRELEKYAKLNNAELSALDQRLQNALTIQQKNYTHELDKLDVKNKKELEDYAQHIRLQSDVKTTSVNKQVLTHLTEVLTEWDLENMRLWKEKKKKLKELFNDLDPNDMTFDREFQMLNTFLIRDIETLEHTNSNLASISKALNNKYKSDITLNL